MPQLDIEIILMRQLATRLALPTFIMDPVGSLLFYNEPAEQILGRRFQETGAIPAAVWSSMFCPPDDAGQTPPAESLLPIIATPQQRPAQRTTWIQGLDDIRRQVEMTVFPLISQEGRLMGSVALVWEISKP